MDKKFVVIFIALFTLTSCGGGGSSAEAPDDNLTWNQDDWNSKNWN